MRRRSLVSALVLFAASAWAQLSVNIKPGAINYAEGQVYLEEQPLRFSTEKSHEIGKGQYLRTGTGKAEVQLGLPATLWLGEQSQLHMVDSNPTNIQLFVDQGSIYVEVIERFEHQRIAIHFGDVHVELKEIGFYRLDSNPPRLRVYNGLAEILQQRGKAKVKPGKSADLFPHLRVSDFDKKQNDPLHVWAGQRSYVLYGRIKKTRNALLLQQRLKDLAYQRQIEAEIQRETFDRIRQAQTNEAVRILEQLRASQPQPPPK